YRPATFASVVGQDAIATTLKNAVMQDHVAQAFLFCGPRGVGKTTCARILAKTINCTHRTPEGEACNECESCRSFNASASFNIFELDAASNNSVDDIRSLVEQVRIPPQGAKYKVYIIDEVHMLSQAAFNAFLKTLEEPPAYAKFILATTEKHKILPTILSRCQVFDFKRIQTEDITRHLMYVAQQEGVSFEEEALRVIARKADGGLRDALSIFDQALIYTSGNITYQKVIENLNVLDLEHYFRMTDYLYEGNVAQALLTFNDILEKGFDGQHFLDGMCEHLRNLMVCRSTETLHLLETSENVRNQYLKQIQGVDVAFLLSCLDLFSKCNTSYKTSNNRRLHVELALMLACRMREKNMPSGNAGTPRNTATPQNPGNTASNVQAAPKPQTAPSSQAAPSAAPAANPSNEAQTLAQPASQPAPQPTVPSAAQPMTQARKPIVKTSPSATSGATASILGTTSIRQMMENLRNDLPQTEATAEVPIQATAEPAESAPATETAEQKPALDAETAAYQLKTQWIPFVRTHCGNNIAAVSLLSETDSVDIQGDLITFKVSNEVAEHSIREVLSSLKPALLSQTGIDYHFDFQYVEKEKQVRIINPEEKFQKLCELNPELLAFKNKLGMAIT
ncbi:MAG: DNA polymerase III subunit gamma/tau, partial [Bacteroidales bacterium]|nr:DNA polymerase III subunit gamma/tau [Bacteroidales bacterium]